MKFLLSFLKFLGLAEEVDCVAPTLTAFLESPLKSSTDPGSRKHQDHARIRRTIVKQEMDIESCGEKDSPWRKTGPECVTQAGSKHSTAVHTGRTSYAAMVADDQESTRQWTTQIQSSCLLMPAERRLMSS